MNELGPFFTHKEFNTENAPDSVKESTYLLVKFAMNLIRKRYGLTIITSGWRSPEDQKRLARAGYKPSKTSQHLDGSACDFICKHAIMREVFEWLRTWWPGQLLYYPIKGHIHIGLTTRDLQRRNRLHSLIMGE